MMTHIWPCWPDEERALFMKLMKSRFRLISLLLLCFFLLTALLCTGASLKAAGVVLPKLNGLLPASPSPPAESPGETPSASPASPPPDGTPEPQADYNVFGL